MYASDVNLCPDTLPHEPKYSHLNKLHGLLAKYASTIITNPAQLATPQHLLWYNNLTHTWQKGVQQLAFVYEGTASGIAFIENECDWYVHARVTLMSFVLILCV